MYGCFQESKPKIPLPLLVGGELPGNGPDRGGGLWRRVLYGCFQESKPKIPLPLLVGGEPPGNSLDRGGGLWRRVLYDDEGRGRRCATTKLQWQQRGNQADTVARATDGLATKAGSKGKHEERRRLVIRFSRIMQVNRRAEPSQTYH